MGDYRAMADQPSCSVAAGKREGAAPVEAALSVNWLGYEVAILI